MDGVRFCSYERDRVSQNIWSVLINVDGRRETKFVWPGPLLPFSSHRRWFPRDDRFGNLFVFLVLLTIVIAPVRICHCTFTFHAVSRSRTTSVPSPTLYFPYRLLRTTECVTNANAPLIRARRISWRFTAGNAIRSPYYVRYYYCYYGRILLRMRIFKTLRSVRTHPSYTVFLVFIAGPFHVTQRNV